MAMERPSRIPFSIKELKKEILETKDKTYLLSLIDEINTIEKYENCRNCGANSTTKGKCDYCKTSSKPLINIQDNYSQFYTRDNSRDQLFTLHKLTPIYKEQLWHFNTNL